MKLNYKFLLFWALPYLIGCSSQENKIKVVDTSIIRVDTTIADSDAIQIFPDTITLLNTPEFYNENLENFLSRPKDELFQEHNNIVGYVLLEPQEFSGNNIPFLCYASENINALYIDNKKVNLIKGKEFFFRQNVKLYHGYNRIPVKILNSLGAETETYLEMNMKVQK